MLIMVDLTRFPCCGKAYPCDVCHDKAEGDHDMKFANRMICGFCGKEQVSHLIILKTLTNLMVPARGFN